MAVVYLLLHIFGFGFIAVFDAQHDEYYFRGFTLTLLWASTSLVASAYFSIRRAWRGQPPAEWIDGILPTAIIFALGWAIWWGIHSLTP